MIIYVREDIPSKLLTSCVLPTDIEAMFLEINFRKSKWLLCGTYHPPSQPDQYFFDKFDIALDVYNNYEKIILVGDFNAQEGEECLDTFLYQHKLTNLVKEHTCYKNPENPSSIDLILTNTPNSFYKTCAFSIGLSDCHKLVLTIFKTTFPKAKSKEVLYRDYKNFNKNEFNQELKEKLSTSTVNDYLTFEKSFLDVLNKQAPIKKKILRANHAPYITKALRKAIMRRSHLQNLYFKKKTPEALNEFKKQKNYCSRLYKKERKKYFSELKISDVTDNKRFWKTIKPLFADKRTLNKQINSSK